MSYRFNMTPRLLLISVMGLLALLVLFFLLGLEIGRQLATPAAATPSASAAKPPAAVINATTAIRPMLDAAQALPPAATR